MGKKKCFFTCLYRSPSQSSDEFDTLCFNFNLFLSNINNLSPASLVVICQFNARNSKWWSSDIETFEGLAIHSLKTSAGYTDLVDQPTRVINNSSFCIDLVFASNPNLICNSGVELSLFHKCHQSLIFGELNFMVPLPLTYKRQIWDYKKADAECIRCSISSVDWNFLFQVTSVNQKVMIFNKHLMNIFHTFIPYKIINCSYKRPLWMTDYRKSRLRGRFKMTRNITNMVK